MNLSKNQDFYSINEPSPYLIHEEKNRGLNENNHDADQESAYKDQVLYPSIQNYQYFDQRDSYQELQESELQNQSPIHMNCEVGEENEIDMGGGNERLQYWIKKNIRRRRRRRRQ